MLVEYHNEIVIFTYWYGVVFFGWMSIRDSLSFSESFLPVALWPAVFVFGFFDLLKQYFTAIKEVY